MALNLLKKQNKINAKTKETRNNLENSTYIELLNITTRIDQQS